MEEPTVREKRIKKSTQDEEERILHSEESDDCLSEDEAIMARLQILLIISDICIVKFVTKEDEQTKYYIDQIVQLHDEPDEISFFHSVLNVFNICFPKRSRCDDCGQE